jgi:hypothetical protein
MPDELPPSAILRLGDTRYVRILFSNSNTPMRLAALVTCVWRSSNAEDTRVRESTFRHDAISYAWGKAGRRRIVRMGQDVREISENLYQFLCQREPVSCPSKPGDDPWMWSP